MTNNKKREWKSYVDLIKNRHQEGKNRVTRSYQMTGLSIAEMLHDEKHRALYIKLAKEHNESFLMAIAKDVAQREHIENKGAYFMKVFNEKLKQKKKK
ncbi:MAG: hypothetical protein WD471_00175 [Candidatus Paceibacterota bacterium]